MKSWILIFLGLLGAFFKVCADVPCLEANMLREELEVLLHVHPDFKSRKKAVQYDNERGVIALVVEGLEEEAIPEVLRDIYSLGADNIYVLRELLGNLFSPVDFYQYLLVDQFSSEAKVKTLFWLVEQGLKVNEAIVSNPYSDSIHILDDFVFYRARDEAFMRGLLALGAVCQDPNFQLEWVGDDLDVYADNPAALMKKRYTYLHAQPEGDALKVPAIMHHIWLTHPDSPREILFDLDEYGLPVSASHFACEKAFILENHAILTKSEDTWQHIVWVNDPVLIPETVKRLEESGIEVRCIQHYAAVIENYALIESMITHKLWGMASDALRYSLLAHFGGVYTDNNFELFHDLSKELRTFDLLMLAGNSLLLHPGFLAVKPKHPVFQALVHLIAQNFEGRDLEAIPQDRAVRGRLTLELTADPLVTAYYKYAQQFGHRDVVFPMSSGLELEIEDNYFQFDYDFVQACPELHAACPSVAKKWAIMEALETLNISMDPGFLVGKDHVCESWLR